MNNLYKLNSVDNNIQNRYSSREEKMNMISHIIGAVFGVVILIMCLIKSAAESNTAGIISSIVFGLSAIILYGCSAYYHGLRVIKYKKIFRILDHCSIYLLIAGTYTAVTLSGIVPYSNLYGFLIFGIVWNLAILAIVLNAISIEKFKVISMILNILIGWVAAFFTPVVIEAITFNGFMFIISGGIIYTVGAVIYGIGRKKEYFHFIFHIMCLLGTLMHFLGIYLYCL